MDRQKIFDFALKIFLFLSPIFFFKAYQLSFARGMLFVLGTFALFGISLGCEPKRKFSNIWVSLFLLLAFARMFFDNSFGDSQAEWFNFWMACSNFIYIFCGVLLFYIVYCYADNIEKYFKPILWVCVLNFLLTFAQIFKGDFMWTHARSICGFMEQGTQLGQYSAMSLPIIFYVNPLLATLPLFTLFASKSISSLLASLVGIGLFCILREIKGKFLLGVGIILILAGLVGFRGYSSKWQGRPQMWQRTLKVALQKPYLGWGYGSFNEAVLKTKGNFASASLALSKPNNDYLHTVQELGTPLVVIIFIYFIELWRKFKTKKNKKRLTYILAISIFTGLVNMSGQTFCRYASVMGTFIILLAFLNVELDDHQI